MTDLERRLAALADELAWPPTPDLVPGVRARIAAEPSPAAGERGARRALPTLGRLRPALRPLPALAAILAALIVAGAVLLAASPGVRADLRRLLGFGSVQVEVVRELPPLRAGRQVDLGVRVSAGEARLNTGRTPPSIGALGPPDASFLAADPPGMLTAAYRPRPGLRESFDGLAVLLSTFRGDPFSFLKKLLAGGTPMQDVEVAGAPGLWIPGPHGIVVADRDGQPTELRPRLASSTLLWLREGVTYRLEADVSLRHALRLARSVG
jgi:hypothetical protein